MNKILIKLLVVVLFSCSPQESKAQTAKEFIEALPVIEIPNLYSKSRQYIVSLEESNHPTIPQIVYNNWKDKTVKYTNSKGVIRERKVRFFDLTATRAIGRVQMRDDFHTVLFCNFKGAQTWGFLVNFDLQGNILSRKISYIEDVEGTGFFSTSETNQIILLESGENDATEEVIKVNDSGYFETISYTVYENGYDFTTPR